MCTTEENVIDRKRARLIDLLSVGLVISHATIDKAILEAVDLQNWEKKISFLEN